MMINDLKFFETVFHINLEVCLKLSFLQSVLFDLGILSGSDEPYRLIQNLNSANFTRCVQSG